MKNQSQPQPQVEEMDGSAVVPTGVDAETIKNIAHKIAVVPEGFNINPKMVGQLARRAKMGDGSSTFGLGVCRSSGFRIAGARWHSRAFEWTGFRTRNVQSASCCSVRHANRQVVGAAVGVAIGVESRSAV